MAEFLELTELDGDKVLLNIEHILKVCPNENGCYVFFDVAIGNDRSTNLSPLHVKENYTVVKRNLL